MGYFGYICPVCSFCIQGNSHLRGNYNTKEEAEKARDDAEDGIHKIVNYLLRPMK